MTKRLAHVGISVRDLDRSIAFYRAGLDMAVVGHSAFDAHTENGRYSRILGLKGAAGKAAMLQSSELRLELFEFAYPAPQPANPARPVCDHGISHFCVEVDDIDAVCERLKAAGAQLHCPPLEFFGTTKATYARDPDGNVIEVMQQVA